MLFDLNTIDIAAILVVILLIVLVPIFLRKKILSGVSRAVLELEELVEKSEKILIDLSKEKGTPEDPEDSVRNFMEFFLIPPFELDPNGIVQKLDKILEMSEERFKHMAQELAPGADEEWKSNIAMTLKATLGIKSVAKQVRHNLELAKKTGNLQILLSLQMSLPLITKIVKAQFKGIEAFSQGKPIGDGLGPLVVGMIMASDSPGELKDQGDMIIAQKDYHDRTIIMARAKGPGARVGKVGKTISNIIETEDIKRIITVDAAVKLEGEESGSIAEGIGVVIGGPGVDKWMIEEEMMKKDLQLEAVIVKMSPEEAISPLNKKLLNAGIKTIPVIEKSILRSDKNTKILLVGVGNSCGLSNVIWNPSSVDVEKEEE